MVWASEKPLIIPFYHEQTKDEIIVFTKNLECLISFVRPLYRDYKLSDLSVDNALFAIDSTSISVSIKLCMWALGKYEAGAIKMHTVLSLSGSIPIQIHITDGLWHDSNMLDLLQIEVNAIYVADKAYVDLEALCRLHRAGAYFIMRPKDNMKFNFIQEHSTGEKFSTVLCDYVIELSLDKSKKLYPDTLRMIKAVDDETGEIITFFTNNFEISAEDVSAIYRHRWDIEVFFKWIKQNIVIKHLWGYSPNAIKTHLWVAICAYYIIAHIKVDYKSKYTITEIATLINVSALARMPLTYLLMNCDKSSPQSNQNIKEQLTLF